jgi:hypothetical protein
LVRERGPNFSFAVNSERVFAMSSNAFRLAWERFRRRAGLEDLHFHDLPTALNRFFEID